METRDKFIKRLMKLKSNDIKDLTDQDVCNLLHITDTLASEYPILLPILKDTIKAIGKDRCRDCFLLQPTVKV